jgi:lysophospholipase L1-like esterase
MKKLVNVPAIAFQAILTIFACFACGKETTMDTPQYISTTTVDTARSATRVALKYLALGDSYTIGQSVQEGARFPIQTVNMLAPQNITIAPPRYIATTGWTTANLINAINAENPAADYDIVTLLIGVNDQYQHMDTAGYRTRFTTLLNTSVALAANRSGRVFVLSIPDYSATPYVSQSDKARVSKEIDDFNAINKQITLAHNIAYIDITPASREAISDPELVANDGLHPSGKKYQKWAMLLAPVIKAALK